VRQSFYCVSWDRQADQCWGEPEGEQDARQTADKRIILRGLRVGSLGLNRLRKKACVRFWRIKNIPQGLKPELYFCGIYGTTEVVQFHDILYKLSPHILYSF
jgi:hypothetical protein